VVEATFELTVECEACKVEIEIGDIEYKLKLITDISVMFFCDLNCLKKWVNNENKEGEKEP